MHLDVGRERGLEGILGRGNNSMLQMQPEVIKYRKFRGQTLVREEEVVEGRDGEHTRNGSGKAGTACVRFGQSG